MIIGRENLDCKRHFAHVLGEHVQGNNVMQTANANRAHTLDCVYLRPSADVQDGHDLLHLATNKVVSCRNIMPLPMKVSTICQVHDIERLDNVPKGLKIQSKTDITLFDSSWSAGVDYEDEMDSESETSSDSDDNSSSTSSSSESSEDMNINNINDLLATNHLESLTVMMKKTCVKKILKSIHQLKI